ncbi:PilZ domain-containing protein [Hyphococcus sp.]|uniref:PilZ domain-containing protein n=1 Tax=Hyphococcus sp. TaxID=2038636 RepID=UPI003D140CC9
MNEKQETGATPVRKSFRFEYSAPVDIVRGSERYSHGVMMNVSRGGAAFRAYVPLEIGAAYQFHIRGVGRLPGIVARRFNGVCYAVKFDVDEGVKRRLDKTLAEIFGSHSIADHAPAAAENQEADFSA